MKSDQKDEETILDSEIDEFNIEEITEKFRKWMISNQDKWVKDVYLCTRDIHLISFFSILSPMTMTSSQFVIEVTTI